MNWARCCFVGVLAGLVLAAGPAGAQTLGEVLAGHGVRTGAGGPADLDEPVTSFAVENARDVFAVAYYRREAADTLPDELRISVLDKAAGSWRHAVLPRVRRAPAASSLAWDAGSILRVSHTSQYVLLDTHRTPSAGRLLVLSRSLQPVASLDGWLAAALPGGRIVYHHSLTHFAPTHPAELWVVDPFTGRNDRLYPTQPYGRVRRAYIEQVRAIYARVGEAWFRVNNHHGDPERFDSAIGPPYAVSPDGRALAFAASFGNVDAHSPAATPGLDVLVVCDVAARRCSEEEAAAARRRCRGRSDGQLLEAAVRMRPPAADGRPWACE
jgi:hypothetical protein